MVDPGDMQDGGGVVPSARAPDRGIEVFIKVVHGDALRVIARGLNDITFDSHGDHTGMLSWERVGCDERGAVAAAGITGIFPIQAGDQRLYHMPGLQRRCGGEGAFVVPGGFYGLAFLVSRCL